MAQMGRPGLSRQQKVELWARWKAGQSLSDIEPQSWQACRVNLWCAFRQRRHSSRSKRAVATLAISARTRRDMPRIGRRIINAEDCHEARPRTIHNQSGDPPE